MPYQLHGRPRRLLRHSTLLVASFSHFHGGGVPAFGFRLPLKWALNMLGGVYHENTPLYSRDYRFLDFSGPYQDARKPPTMMRYYRLCSRHGEIISVADALDISPARRAYYKAYRRRISFIRRVYMPGF